MFLVRRDGQAWHEPLSTTYDGEKTLQDLVRAEPTLLPGRGAAAVADEFWIPDVGSVDLLTVGGSGEITLVECKLRANSETRRAIVGQLFAYASGLWEMSWSAFASTFERRVGVGVESAVEKAMGVEVDPDDLRESITRRLADGEFRLVLCVDEITSELRRIVQYLNQHTQPSVSVLALELQYTRDGDIEILVPRFYGEEASEEKAKQSKNGGWTEESFRRELDQRTGGTVRAFIERLLAHGSQNGHHAFWGSGKTPGMSYYYELDGVPTSVWALYLREGGPTVSLSLGSVSKTRPDKASAWLQAMKTEPGLARALNGVDDQSLNKYPGLRIGELLDREDTGVVFFAALDALIASQPDAA